MTGRLLAALALALAWLVLVPSGPAAACTCVGLEKVMEDEQDVAFVGVLKRQVSDDSKVISRVRVEEVFAGDVHRIQDVISGRDTCGVEWSDGERVLVLGDRDEESRIVTGLCSSAVEGDEQYDAALARLGEGTEPMAGSDLVERDGWFVRDYAWIKLVVGLIGLAALGVIAARWQRTRRA